MIILLFVKIKTDTKYVSEITVYMDKMFMALHLNIDGRAVKTSVWKYLDSIIYLIS